MDLSVIVCTRNRAALLRGCLASLLEGIPSNIKVEVIVVDNGSSDDTRDVVLSFQERFSNLKLVSEMRMGLSIARNMGIKEATGGIICFIDDDVVVEKKYLLEVLSPFRNKDIVCVGGKVIGLWPEGRIPDWFSPKFGHVISETPFGEKSRYMKKNEFPFGCNIAFRKEVFVEVGGFNEMLGKRGDNLIYGEEIDLCHKLQAEHRQFYYHAEALVHHHVSGERATKKYFLNSLFGKGITEGYQKRHNQNLWIFIMFFLVKIVYIFCSEIVMQFVRLSDKEKFRLQCQISYNMGYLYYALLRSPISNLS